MKHLLLVIVAGFLMDLATLAQPNKAVEYRFEVIPSGAATYGWYYKNATILATSSNMVFGSGLNGLTGFRRGPNAIPDTALWAERWSSTFDLTDYFGWTMTPPPLNILVIDSVTWRKRISGTGPRFQRLRSDANGDNFVTNIWTSPSDSSTAWVKRSVVSNLPSAPGSITMRLYGFGSTNIGGTIRIDTLRVYAHLISTLPIELLSFDGHKTLDGVQLDWTTATERDNDYFTLLRSADAENCEPIGFVDGAGNSTSAISYSFVDDEPLPGINYYQLQQTDWNGDSTLSHIVAVQFQEIGTLNYPVDSWVSWDGKPTTRLDVLGRRTGNVSVQHFFDKPGIYFLQTQVGETVRLVIHTP